MIPPGWEEKTLGEICEFRNGLWTGKKEPFIECNVIRNANFSKDFKLNYDNVVRISVEEKQFHPRELKYGDLILEKSGGGPNQPVGRVVIFDKHENGYSFSNFTSLIRIKNKELINFRFLYLYLCYCYLSGMTIKMQKNSTGIRNLIFDEYKNIRAPIPNIKEQERIVAKLDEAFEAIDKVKANAEQNLTNAKELFESALNKALLKSETANIKTTFGKEFKIKSGDFLSAQHMDVGGKYNVYGGNGVNGNYNHYNCSGENIIIGRVGEKCGNVHYVNEDVWVTDNAFILTQTEHPLDKKFLYYLLTKLNLRKYAAKSTHPVISGKSMKDVLVCFPDNINTQQKIVEQLDKLQEQTKQLEAIYTKKIKECDELKQSILQKAFRGEL